MFDMAVPGREIGKTMALPPLREPFSMLRSLALIVGLSLFAPLGVVGRGTADVSALATGARRGRLRAG